MESQLFRKKSMERVTSPERLQDYIRVTNPGIWMVLAAVIALLVGLIVVGSLSRLETKLPVEADAQGGLVHVRLNQTVGEAVKPGMTLRVHGVDTEIELVYLDDAEDIVCAAKMNLPDGLYDAEIITESIAPISFLIN